MSRRLLIRNAHVVLPDSIVEAAVAIQDGSIVAVDPPPNWMADEVFDAGGLHLLPGVD